MNGPGNFAIDGAGSVWVDDNYIPEPPTHSACAGRRLVRFTPWGAIFPGSPYLGGGLSGQGWGIGFDPGGDIWVSNFGFQDPPCADTKLAAASNSVSLFSSNGKAISPKGGYTNGAISWAQGVFSDRTGNIWIANCGNDSVTEFPNGDPSRALNIPLGAVPAPGAPQIKPFGIVIDLTGNVWVTNNRNNTVSVLSPNGALIDTLPGAYQSQTVSDSSGGERGRQQRKHLGRELGLARRAVPDQKQRWRRYPPLDHFVPGGHPHPLSRIAIHRRRAYDSLGTLDRWQRHGLGVQLRSGPRRSVEHRTHRNKQLLRHEHEGLPAGAWGRGPDFAQHGLSERCPVRITGGQIDPSGNIWMTGNWKIDGKS